MMEWVETTARTVEEAKELALDQLGVVADDAEFEVLAEPKQGLFGRVRGEARVRARVRPTPVRPKQERRRGRKAAAGAAPETSTATADTPADDPADDAEAPRAPRPATPRRSREGGRAEGRAAAGNGDAQSTNASTGGPDMTTDERADAEPSEADVALVRDAATEFVGGLSTAFGFDATVDASVEGSEIEVRVEGPSLGLMIGPGGRTLLAIQDLARVAAQRRLGDHDTRLRVDVSGYREKRRVALERFATSVAEQVKETGVARSLDPMPSADRKVLHDALAAIDGVTSRSEGEDPNRRVVVAPD
jgi:spoIIIJ-associated protein